MVTQIGHNIVHNINQEWNYSLLLIAIEHHVQQMSQHLMKRKKKSANFQQDRHFCCLYYRGVMMVQNMQINT